MCKTTTPPCTRVFATQISWVWYYAVLLTLHFSLHSVATDDQYASNIPDTAHQQPLALSQRHSAEEPTLLSPDDAKGKAGGAGEGGGSGKEVGIRYLSQLRQSPFPINGVYKLHHNTAHNHFRSPADIKHRGWCLCPYSGGPSPHSTCLFRGDPSSFGMCPNPTQPLL